MIQQPAKIQSLERDKGPQILPPNCQVPPVESADVQKVRAKHCKSVEEFSVKDMLGYMRKQSSENNQCAKAKPGLSDNMRKRAQNLPRNCSTQGSNFNSEGKENLGAMSQVGLDFPVALKEGLENQNSIPNNLLKVVTSAPANSNT